MRKGNIYTVYFRRKRKGFTNYRKRLKILTSKKPRLVVRKSLKNIQANIIEYNQKGDIVKVTCHSSVLKKLGWNYGTGNLPAAYLVGFMLGTKAKASNFKDAVFDIGINKSVKGSRVYAVLAGALDAGLKVPYGDDILPDKDRLSGKHIAGYAQKLKNEDMLKKQFGSYVKSNADPDNIAKKVEEVKGKIKNIIMVKNG
ncbi:50S ribosomal protein L18 [Candidatus Woesearchaeota archaeon]|nr:50S ribosomal protein L18 [Candidatus Woesearchaeota archaeon]